MGNIASVIRCLSGGGKNRKDFTTWSGQVEARIPNEGLVPVLKSEIMKMRDVAESEPEFLFDQIEKWMRADSQYSSLATTDNIEACKHPTPKHPACSVGKSLSGVVERDRKPVKVYHNTEFYNWGDTITNAQKYIFVPKTKAGVQNIVKYAKEHKLRVRVSGSRHSWTDVFGSDGGVMISTMEIDAAVASEDWAKEPFKTVEDNPYDERNELQRIEFLGETEGGQHALIRLGCGTTSEHFRQWALSEQAFKGRGGKWEWMIHALPILVSITSAGWTQVICHGAGVRHQSVSDLCKEIEFVNFNGELQTVSDSNQLKALTGGFGLFGVITSHVFEMDPMKVANLVPLKVPTPLCVPPLTYDGIPKNDDFSTKDYTREEWQQATERYLTDCNRFYSEWFWFPFHKQGWINCWDTEEKGPNPQPQYPTRAIVKLQNVESRVFWIFQNTLLKFLPAIAQAELFSNAAMTFLPPTPLVDTKTTVPDALHFRRGIHRMPVLDCEFSVEIPRGPNGIDFSICQKLWWAAIDEVYKDKERGKAPMRVTLEMRIVGGSDVTLSTQYGNAATCCIEVLTSTLVERDEWDDFIIRIGNRWAGIARGLKCVPHFGKEWPKQIGGQKIGEYLKRTYANRVPEFVSQCEAAAAAGGYTFDEALSLFGNDTIMDLIGKK